MKFKKINDSTIRCIISQEEMWEKGIEIDDFLEHRDKTEDFLREIVEQAKDELDMEGIGRTFSVQMSVMRTGEISLLIVEDDQENMQRTLENFRERLQGFQEALQEARKMAESGGDFSEKERTAQRELSGETKKETARRELPGETKEEPAGEKGADTTYGDTPLWVLLDSMDNVLTVCRRLKGRKIITSHLYKYEGKYYLRLQFAHCKKDITDAIMTLSEYCSFAFTEEQGGYALAERGQLLWGEDAVEQLALL